LNQRKERTARKLDRTAALEQHARGLSTTEISTLQGVNPSTVWRFLDRSAPQRQALEEFKRGRGNEFATLASEEHGLAA
jgi:DNA-directed RNA polymerase specialized sigma24 family protein